MSVAYRLATYAVGPSIPAVLTAQHPGRLVRQILHTLRSRIIGPGASTKIKESWIVPAFGLAVLHISTGLSALITLLLNETRLDRWDYVALSAFALTAFLRIAEYRTSRKHAGIGTSGTSGPGVLDLPIVIKAKRFQDARVLRGRVYMTPATAASLHVEDVNAAVERARERIEKNLESFAMQTGMAIGGDPSIESQRSLGEVAKTHDSDRLSRNHGRSGRADQE